MNLSTSFVLYQECPDDVGDLLELIAALAAEWLAPPYPASSTMRPGTGVPNQQRPEVHQPDARRLRALE